MSSTSVLRRSLPALLAISALVGGAHVANAQEVLTNTTGTRQGIARTSLPPSVAGGFLLSDGPWNLFDITVGIGASLPNGGVNPITASLWSDSAGEPGVELAALSLTGGTLGTAVSPLTFSPTGTVTLSANTQYWFVARASAPGDLLLQITNTNTNTGAHGTNTSEVLRRSGDGNWGRNPNTFPVMTVRGVRPTGGDPVPEPSEWAAMGVLGLGLGGLVLRRRRAA